MKHSLGANMKRQLRCHEAEVFDLHEAKHTRAFPCAEGTLHRATALLHFSYTAGVLHLLLSSRR